METITKLKDLRNTCGGNNTSEIHKNLMWKMR